MTSPLKVELLSEICHAATRLQSATMIHRAQVREFAPGAVGDSLQREADAIVAQTERLAFLVAQLRDSVGQCFARHRLMEAMEREAGNELTITDSEGGHCA